MEENRSLSFLCIPFNKKERTDFYMSKLVNLYQTLKEKDSETLYLFKSGIFYIFLDSYDGFGDPALRNQVRHKIEANDPGLSNAQTRVQ